MKKSFLVLSLVCLTLGQTHAQTAKFDTMAVSIMDRMSEFVGELSSCSATVNANYDVNSQELGLIKHSDVEHVYIGGADKLLITSQGDKGDRQMFYDGKMFTYYSVDKNHYAQVKAPGNVVDMIDQMNKDYGIIFPMADFMYPTFVDDILHDASSLVLLGITKVDGKECYHIAGASKDKTFQFWISEGPFYVPVKMVIINTAKEHMPQYEATYTDWQINPVLPASIFEFKMPPGAQKIKLHPVNSMKNTPASKK